MKARSFVTLMIVVALSSLILRFAVEKIIQFNILQNEAAAQESLRLVSAALENYAKDNQGVFPENLSALSESSPPYLEGEYLAPAKRQGYSYDCLRLEPSGYSCSAMPLNCRLTGEKVYRISTGGLLISEGCVNTKEAE